MFEAAPSNLYATCILDIDTTFGSVAGIVLRRVPVAIGNVFESQAEALDATEATRAFERHEVPSVVGEGHALDAEVFKLTRIRLTMQTEQTLAAWSNNFGSCHVFSATVVVKRLGRTVEIEFPGFIEQFVGVAHVEELVVVDSACPCHRVEDSAKGLLEAYDDGVAPFVKLAWTENLLGPGFFLHDLHVLGIAEEMQFGIGYKLDAIYTLSGTKCPWLISRDLEIIQDACTLRTLMGSCHHGASAIDEKTAQFDGTVEMRFPKISVDTLPSCHGASSTEDGCLSFGSTEGDGVSVTPTEALVNVEWFGELIGAAGKLDDDVFLLGFAQLLLHLLQHGGEVRGICLENLLGDERLASDRCKDEGEEDGEFHVG